MATELEVVEQLHLESWHCEPECRRLSQTDCHVGAIATHNCEKSILQDANILATIALLVKQSVLPLAQAVAATEKWLAVDQVAKPYLQRG